MYCPKCGVKQVSAEIRFCYRCGFQLSVVTGLLSTDGVLPGSVMPPVPPPKPPLSPRKQGVRQGAKLMFLSLVTLPVVIGLSVVSDWPGFLIIPFTIFLAGLAWMVYSAIFGEEYAPIPMQPTFPPLRMNPQQLNAPPQHFHTPPVDNQRATVPPPRRVNTSEIVPPPSVTENTTKLFDKDSQ